jgi:rhodanese-related sulfurtransferase
MPSNISAEKFSRLVGTPECPALIDVRTEDEWDPIPFLIRGALRPSHGAPAAWPAEFTGRLAVVICKNGARLVMASRLGSVTRVLPQR